VHRSVENRKNIRHRPRSPTNRAEVHVRHSKSFPITLAALAGFAAACGGPSAADSEARSALLPAVWTPFRAAPNPIVARAVSDARPVPLRAPVVPVAALQAVPCATGRDCPRGQGCGSDQRCHADGACNAFQANPNCPAGDICANAGNDDPDGFCTDGRGGPDPYCRSDGLGACRERCNHDGTCAFGSCVNGYCHRSDECVRDSDCSPNHVCGLPPGWEDDGYHLCLKVANPVCVPDGLGACRLPCATDVDCFDGGYCKAADGLCHASNECSTNASCPAGEICHSSAEFGGLCGPPRLP
jgi:hypothetical protein